MRGGHSQVRHCPLQGAGLWGCGVGWGWGWGETALLTAKDMGAWARTSEDGPASSGQRAPTAGLFSRSHGQPALSTPLPPPALRPPKCRETW